MRVPVAVAAPRRDHRDGCPDGAQEGGLAGRAAVVRDLQQVRAEQVRRRLEQVALGRLLGVAREEDGEPAPPDAQHQGRVVGLAVGPSVGPARRRPQDVDHEVADGRPLRRLGGVERDLAVRRHPTQRRHRLQVAVDVPQPQRPDLRLLQDLRQTVHVVGVGMRQHDEVELAPAVAP